MKGVVVIVGLVPERTRCTGTWPVAEANLLKSAKLEGPHGTMYSVRCKTRDPCRSSLLACAR